MDPSPDVVLINPGNRTQIYQSLGESLNAIEPPLWIGLIATYLRNQGCRVVILDSEAYDLAPSDTARNVAELHPKLACVIVYGSQPSASTQKMTGAGAICHAIKEASPEIPLLMGGVHVSALPLKTLLEESVDYVCEGEGPLTILALVRALKSGRSDLEKVPGLWYRSDSRIVHQAAAPLIRDLDPSLPQVAWDLLPMEKYRAHNWHCFGHVNERWPYAVLYTTLGCPFKCMFCCINAPFGGPSYRLRSPDAVAREVDLLVHTYGVRNIKIIDEMFVLHRAHVQDICDRLIERDYNLNIWAYARVDTVYPPMLDKLRKAGITWLALGIESASEFVRDGVDKKFSIERIRSTVRAIQDSGISVIGNFIFGLPDDDLLSMQHTLDLALDLRCEFANFYCAMAYPGSKLYSVAIENGWKLPEHWHAYSQHAFDTQPLPTDRLSATEVLRFRDAAFHTYFTNPGYLAYVAARFGMETADHIKTMTAHRLQRKLLD